MYRVRTKYYVRGYVETFLGTWASFFCYVVFDCTLYAGWRIALELTCVGTNCNSFSLHWTLIFVESVWVDIKWSRGNSDWSKFVVIVTRKSHFLQCMCKNAKGVQVFYKTKLSSCWFCNLTVFVVAYNSYIFDFWSQQSVFHRFNFEYKQFH